MLPESSHGKFLWADKPKPCTKFPYLLTKKWRDLGFRTQGVDERQISSREDGEIPITTPFGVMTDDLSPEKQSISGTELQMSS